MCLLWSRTHHAQPAGCRTVHTIHGCWAASLVKTWCTRTHSHSHAYARTRTHTASNPTAAQAILYRLVTLHKGCSSSTHPPHVGLVILPTRCHKVWMCWAPRNRKHSVCGQGDRGALLCMCIQTTANNTHAPSGQRANHVQPSCMQALGLALT